MDGNSGRWDGRAMNSKEAHEQLEVDLECPIPPRGYAPAGRGTGGSTGRDVVSAKRITVAFAIEAATRAVLDIKQFDIELVLYHPTDPDPGCSEVRHIS